MVRAKLQDGTFTSSYKVMFGTAPVFFTLSLRSRLRHPRQPRAKKEPLPPLPTLVFDCTYENETQPITYRSAIVEDLPNICKFVDFWLSGGAKRLHIPGGGQDFFVPRGRQEAYIKYKTTCLATYLDEIIGWAVKSRNETLIHLLVSAMYRGKGIGGHMLKILNPSFVRSKSDQSTGDPLKFYQKHGYEIIEAGQGKNKNIDIMEHQKPEPVLETNNR